MDTVQVAKSTQEQAVASWVNHLNQLRLNALLERLACQDKNLDAALAELEEMKQNITHLLLTNRGGTKGQHGFIAEAAEVGIENARNLIKGLDAVCEWVNDNGPADILRDGVEIQQKFVQAGGHLGLEAIQAHMQKYPDFLKNGGKYQIPKDFYDQLQEILNLSQEEAAKSSNKTYALWKWVHEYFEANNIDPKDIEPAVVDYGSVQTGTIDKTIEQEKDKIKEEDKKRRAEAHKAAKPTLKQGAQAAGVSAATEGGMRFCLGVAKKLHQGKRLEKFTAEDWQELGIDTAKGAAQGGIRGAALYAMTNFTATPAAAANALVTAAFGVTSQGWQLRQGNITEEEFLINSEVLCMEVSISAVSAALGQAAIPIPILGAVLGNAVGTVMYQLTKDHLTAKEQKMVAAYRTQMAKLERQLEEKYQRLLRELKAELERFKSFTAWAFDKDVNKAFLGSIALAGYTGVPEEQVLRTKEDIDNFFLS